MGCGCGGRSTVRPGLFGGANLGLPSFLMGGSWGQKPINMKKNKTKKVKKQRTNSKTKKNKRRPLSGDPRKNPSEEHSS